MKCRAVQLAFSLFVLVASTDAYAAVDQATLDRLVDYAKQGCLSGSQFDFNADVNGNVTLKNLLKPGAEGKASVNVRNSAGATAIFEQQVRVVADQQVRDCMKPYIDRIFQFILGSTPRDSRSLPSSSALPSPYDAEIVASIAVVPVVWTASGEE
jgi:hypothetical protein